jgi:hypothetical protein
MLNNSISRIILLQDSQDFRNFSLKEKLKDEKYEELKDTMVEVRLS